MKSNWETTLINPQHIIGIADGDKDRMKKYLRQFQELIPTRIEILKESLRNNNRKMTRQILHQMCPQIEFFGIQDVIQPIKKLEIEYETMPSDDLKTLVENIIIKLDKSVQEVHSILETKF
jgi:hypothetical protein